MKKHLNTDNLVLTYLLFCTLSYLSIVPLKILNLANIFFYGMGYIYCGFYFYKKVKNKDLDFIHWLVLAFLGANIASIVYNHAEIIGNLKTLAIMMLQLVVVFCYVHDLNKEEAIGFIRKLCLFYVILLTVISTINIILYFMDIIIVNGNTRYNGIFTVATNSSTCSLAAVLALLFILLENNKKMKLFMIFSLIMQIGYMPLSASRGAQLFLFVGCVMTLISYAFINYKPMMKKLLMSFLLLFVFMTSTLVVEKTFPMIKNSIHTEVKQNYSVDQRKDTEKSNSIRGNMIKAGIHTFKKHPILGVTSRNLAEVVTKENKEIYLKGIEGAGLHNTYMQVLVSNGILGFGITTILILYVLWNLYKKWKVNYDNAYVFSILLAFFAYMLLSVLIYYFIETFALIFFAFLGYASQKDNNDV